MTFSIAELLRDSTYKLSQFKPAQIAIDESEAAALEYLVEFPK